MILLGVDPGFAVMGFAAVELHPDKHRDKLTCWVVRTEPSHRKRNVRASEDNVRRTREIAKAVSKAIYEHEPLVLCVETMSWPRNAGSVAKIALAWGALCAVAERHGIAIVQASPQEVKKAVTGSKTASKAEVIQAIEARWPDVVWPEQATLVEHAADAAAVVLATLDSDVVRLARRASA